jgi:signal transduction histidine kinase
MLLQPLDRLRIGLTAWYVASFSAILALLGGGLFFVIRHQFSQQLDESLREATTVLVRAARIREMEAASAHGTVVDALDELHIPDRTLYLLDTAGRPVKPAIADAWIRNAARRAARAGSADEEFEPTEKRTLRMHAERFTLASGGPLVAAAVADRAELEERYASLIAAFGGSAVAALILVAAASSLMVRKSTAPTERTIEHMRRFMADAAHELRTPLTVLRSRAEVTLEQPRTPAAYASALRGIESEAERLGKIVEDLLTLARADAGERQIARDRVYLDDLALDAAGTARIMAQAKGVTLTVEEFEEAMVTGEAALLRQLVMILLDNAVKFTQPGGQVRVRVSTEFDRPTLVVEDTGSGMTRDQLPHIFERFWRGDPARSRGNADGAPPNGAGLGLSIARWVADEHSAEIQVESELGHGTRVLVRFPPPDTPQREHHPLSLS